MTGEPLSIDTLPDDFVPCDAYVAEYWAQLRANCCTMDLAHAAGPYLNIHALEAGHRHVENSATRNDDQVENLITLVGCVDIEWITES